MEFIATIFLRFLLLAPFVTAGVGYFWPPIWWSSLLWGPLLLLAAYDVIQTKHAILRNFPILGHLRYLLELIRPEIMQYFVETDTEGRPVNRIFRSLVYQRAKKVRDTVPFGTQMDTYVVGYEWMDHSIYPIPFEEIEMNPRVMVGGSDCSQPYSASLLNISAMSFGSLSRTAIEALNGGAKLGNFAHNTGEGGISSYHLEEEGDLIWQIGTGYFGCRTPEGKFSPEAFAEKASISQVKMIEIKISQGAKPGHGGILPAGKNTPEIAEIRGVKAHTNVFSPPYHTKFRTPLELMQFVAELRKLSKGKPIGFKLCIGKPGEFFAMCQAMIETGIKPDFITIDGGEGGTGAAPVEFSNSLGRPLRDGLTFAYDTLVGFDLKKDIKIFASGKIFSGFHMARTFAMGADACYSARAMMMALGCIQALQCDANTCPVGVATQDKKLYKGLDVADKKARVANFHGETILSFQELLAAGGIRSSEELQRHHINRRVSMNQVLSYEEIYPYQKVGSLLGEQVDSKYQRHLNTAKICMEGKVV